MKTDILYVLNTTDYSCLLIRINGELIEKIVCMSEKLTRKRLHITLFLESYHTPKLYTLLILCNHSLLPQLSFPIHFTLHLQPNPRRKIIHSSLPPYTPKLFEDDCHSLYLCFCDLTS